MSFNFDQIYVIQAKTVPMYNGKVRVRVCGVLIEKGRVLLLKHDNLGTKGFIWSFPGGGVEFQESLNDCLRREFIEETGLTVEVGDHLFINEYIDEQLHAIEVFFEVKRVKGEITLGKDPELETQILTDIQFFSTDELQKIEDLNKHNIFFEIDHVEDIIKLRGYYKFGLLRK